MRELTSHKVNGLNKSLQIVVCDEPGRGGANHEYQIIDVSAQNTSPDGADNVLASIGFQNGPISEAGINGISQEALLAILIDRLEGFQRGPYACDMNAYALGHLKDAMDRLHDRTRERISRGVEGTMEK